MNLKITITLLAILTTLSGPTIALAQTPPQGYKLVWSDEFNGPLGSEPNPAKWHYDDGPGYSNNGELETNKVTPGDCRIVNDPGAVDHKALDIVGTPNGDGTYTSVRMNTRGLFSAQYGYFVARMKIPAGQGMWPAFWLLGNNIDTSPWPACGEVDIMENIGKEPGTVHGSIHGTGYVGGKVTMAYTLPNGVALSDTYHTYAVDWRPGKMTFYLDGAAYAVYTPASIPNGSSWCFDSQPFYIILNLAIGGFWPGNPDSTTPFPAHLLVDYVRVYQLPK